MFCVCNLSFSPKNDILIVKVSYGGIRIKAEDFKLIQNIIEQDSTDTSYKYALLKAVVEISQESDHLLQEIEDQVQFPLGLIVEKWLYYYFPIFANDRFIPQKNGETEELASGNRITFRPDFHQIIDFYKQHHGQNSAYTAFVDDLRQGNIPQQIEPRVQEVVKSIRETIKRMPMKHLGYSHFQDHYAVFQFQTKTWRSPKDGIDRKFLINELDTFTFSKSLFELFHFIGSFIAGENSILTTWAEFSVNVDKSQKTSLAEMIEVLKTDITETREVREARKFFVNLLENQGKLTCVWSGEEISSTSDMDIDHVLPFSSWKNNDLWNLLPTKSSINSVKSNKIPSLSLLEKSKHQILAYWHDLLVEFGDLFTEQLVLGLAGISDEDKLFEQAFDNLKKKCEYLVTIRGHEMFNI